MVRLILVLLLFITTFNAGYTAVFYRLDISIDTKNSSLRGGATITSDRPEVVKLSTEGLDVVSVFYGEEKIPVKSSYKLEITPEKSLTVIYNLKLSDYHSENIITDEAVSLLGNWYPFVGNLAVYSLKVEVPQGFILISEAEEEKVEKKDGKTYYSFKFPYPLEHIHLIGTTKYVVKERNFGDVKIQAYFFERDKELMDRYLQKTEEYIKLYSERIGRFPYKRFAIVENFFPTGYSMPTFTLIGQQIIRFPFVLNQSLPHEILHQWFGCSIYVDDIKGNWAEGLTTYLSDYYFSEDKRMYRKNSILKYMAFAKDDYPLTQFRGKTDRKSEAIGYGKTMMVFYMLEDIVGREKFNNALRFLYKNFRFKRVSWEDIKSVYENEYKKDLDWFFSQWIKRKGMPELQIKIEDHTLKDDGFHIKLKVKQSENYKVKLPVFVETYLGTEKHEVWIDKKEEEIEIISQDEPLRVIVDRDYQIFRKLQWEETNPVIYFTLADRKAVVFLSDRDIYSPITAYYAEGTQKNPDQFSFSDVYGKNVVILGSDNPVLKKIFGKKFQSEDFVEVFKNPFGEDKVITVFNLSSYMQAKMIAGRIKHYGKYSKIKLNGFRIVKKSVKNYQNGMTLKVRQKAEIVSDSGIKEFKNIIEDALKSKVIYVGEQHTMFSNHAMQLSIIKGIYSRYPKIAVGMEMFQRSKQDVIDRYLRGEIDEKQFLKQSEYYRAWKYNYHLYRPIIQFCRENNIRIIALNADRELVRKVSEKGIQSLSAEEMKKLPEDMDFSSVRYVEYLKGIFSEHGSSVTKRKKFINFLQSQIIWDETMAETVSHFLTENPDYKIIVLAGGGHVRFRYGIPSRVERRTGERGLVVLMDDQLKKGIADYIVYTAHLTGVKERKIGVYIEETGKGLKVVKVKKNSPAEKAGIKKGDIIVQFNGREIKDLVDLKVELFFSQQENSITVLRNGKKVKMKLTFED